MRWLPVVLVVAGLATTAIGDPIRIDLLVQRTRHADAAVRAAAAEQLAKLRRSPVAVNFVASAAISDDPTVRSILLDALVAEQLLPKAGVIHVPTASVMARMLPRLYPKRTGKDLPEVTSCSVTGGTERSATIVCTISRCEHIMHVTLELEITTGVRWTAAQPRRKAVADGSCGDIM